MLTSAASWTHCMEGNRFCIKTELNGGMHRSSPSTNRFQSCESFDSALTSREGWTNLPIERRHMTYLSGPRIKRCAFLLLRVHCKMNCISHRSMCFLGLRQSSWCYLFLLLLTPAFQQQHPHLYSVFVFEMCAFFRRYTWAWMNPQPQTQMGYGSNLAGRQNTSPILLLQQLFNLAH